MADSSVSFMGGEADAPAASVEAPKGSAPASARSVTELMQTLTSPSHLSADGEGFVNKLISQIEKTCPVKQVKINTNNYEARVLVAAERYIISLVFSETFIQGPQKKPVAAVCEDLKARMVQGGVAGENFLFLVITREDYSRADLWAAAIENALAAATRPEIKGLSISQFSGANFKVTTDIQTVRTFVQQNCPSATMPRMDVGILVYASDPIRDTFDQNGRQETQQLPIVAVTGFTDFTSVPNNMSTTPLYAPTLIITGIFSRIVHKTVGVLGVALAVEVLLRNRRWVDQFARFAKGSPDIANLITDDKGKPYTSGNITERNKVIECYLQDPRLAIDLQLGGFMIPGLKELLENPAAFNAEVDAFTGGKGASNTAAAVLGTVGRYDGRSKMAGAAGTEWVDTRTVDYLFLIASGAQPAEASEFLSVPDAQPWIISDAVTKFYANTELLFGTYRAYLNPVWIKAVADDMTNAGFRISIDGGLAPNSYNVGSIAGFAPSGFGTSGMFAMNNGLGGFQRNWGW